MTRYSVQPRDQIFVKGYGFFSFARSMGRNIGKNISKHLNRKHSQKPLDHAMHSATDKLRTASKEWFKKTVEGTGDLIGQKVADRIAKVSKTSPQSNSETNERFIPPELRQNYWWSKNKRRKLMMI